MSVGIQQQHLERSARVEVPHLIALQAMQCREIARRFERDDCARHAAALAAVTRRQTGAGDPVVAGVGDAEPCTFLRYWRRVESSDERARNPAGRGWIGVPGEAEQHAECESDAGPYRAAHRAKARS
jgi:hypothetical protein